MSNLVFTPEVKAIIEADRAAKPGEVIVVAALPGTGNLRLRPRIVP